MACALVASVAAPRCSAAQQPTNRGSNSAYASHFILHPDPVSGLDLYLGCGRQGDATSGSGALSISMSCAFPGAGGTFLNSTPFAIGSFVTTGIASVNGGSLAARAMLSGSVAANNSVNFDASAQVFDALTVTGVNPAYVVFNAAIHGVISNLGGGTNWRNDSFGRTDLTAWKVDGTGRISIGNGVGSVSNIGDGSTNTGSFTVLWTDYAYNGALYFSQQLIAFGRLTTSGAASNIAIDSDYSQTAGLSGIRLLDANHVDITDQAVISRESTALVATPEPHSLALMLTGLVGILGTVRRRQARSGSQFD